MAPTRPAPIPEADEDQEAEQHAGFAFRFLRGSDCGRGPPEMIKQPDSDDYQSNRAQYGRPDNVGALVLLKVRAKFGEPMSGGIRHDCVITACQHRKQEKLRPNTKGAMLAAGLERN